MAVTLDGEPVESLAVLSDEPWRATFVGRAPRARGGSRARLLLRRDRYVGQGMREDLILENLAGEPAAVRIEVSCDADFADLFEVKESRVPPVAGRTCDGRGRIAAAGAQLLPRRRAPGRPDQLRGGLRDDAKG